MHGIVFAELQKFVVTKHGYPGWTKVAEKAGLAHKVYLATGQYPDAEIVSLVTAASAITGQEAFQIVEAFGEFIVPSLLKMYGHLLRPNWRSLDVIEHTEGTVHTVVRASDKDALPPKLRTRRTAPDTVILAYVTLGKRSSSTRPSACIRVRRSARLFTRKNDGTLRQGVLTDHPPTRKYIHHILRKWCMLIAWAEQTS